MHFLSVISAIHSIIINVNVSPINFVHSCTVYNNSLLYSTWAAIPLVLRSYPYYSQSCLECMHDQLYPIACDCQAGRVVKSVYIWWRSEHGNHGYQPIRNSGHGSCWLLPKHKGLLLTTGYRPTHKGGQYLESCAFKLYTTCTDAFSCFSRCDILLAHCSLTL